MTSRIQVTLQRTPEGKLLRPVSVFDEGHKETRWDGVDVVGCSCRIRVVKGESGEGKVAFLTDAELLGIHDPELEEEWVKEKNRLSDEKARRFAIAKYDTVSVQLEGLRRQWKAVGLPTKEIEKAQKILKGVLVGK